MRDLQPARLLGLCSLYLLDQLVAGSGLLQLWSYWGNTWFRCGILLRYCSSIMSVILYNSDMITLLFTVLLLHLEGIITILLLHHCDITR